MLAKILNFPLRALPGWWKRGHTIAVIVLLTTLLHAWAVWQLPLDADEPVYMRAGREYAELISRGDWQGVIDYDVNREHPPLVKIIYSLPFLIQGDGTDPDFEFYFNRAISAFFGILQVLALSLVDPLAGFMLAFHSYTLKYTSQVYLEAFPLFASLLSVVALRRYFERHANPSGKFWWVSALAFGTAVAGKYPYGLMIIPAAILMVQYRKQVTLRQVLLWGGLTAGAFFLLNPYLWNDPLNRLVDSLLFHSRYTQGADVVRAGYPWWQPFIWVATALQWHPRVFFFLTLDEFIFWAGAVGIYVYGRKEPWLAGWFVIQFVLLLIYPTKWPQYSLIVIPALCMLASGFLRSAYNWVMARDSYWDYLEEMLPKPPRIFWWLVIGFTLLIVVGKVTYEYDRALARRGWMQLAAATSPLPADTIYDLTLRSNGDMMLGTSRGAALWHVTAGSPWGEESRVFNTRNSPILNDQVQVIFEDREGRLWFGSDLGVSRLEGETWQSFRAVEMGLSGARVRAIAQDGSGRMWMGALEGLAVWDGVTWISYSQKTGDILDNNVFTLAVQAVNGGEMLWVGTKQGVARLDLTSGEWSNWDFSNRNLGWGGVSQLLVDSQNRVWMATIGGGMAYWDGEGWNEFRLGANGIPTSIIRSMVEAPDGGFFLGMGFPTEPGGLVSYFDGRDRWVVYQPTNSGFSGGEPLALAMDTMGRLWIGSAIDGLQIFDLAVARK